MCYVRYEHRNKVLYLKVLKVLCGCIKSRHLWYTHFTKALEKEGFKINSRNLCIANKIIDEKIYTITWYVDNLKISHVDHETVRNIISMMESEYGTITFTRGSKYTYICINIEFIRDGKVNIQQPKYLKESIPDFGENVTTTVSSAA